MCHIHGPSLICTLKPIRRLLRTKTKTLKTATDDRAPRGRHTHTQLVSHTSHRRGLTSHTAVCSVQRGRHRPPTMTYRSPPAFYFECFAFGRPRALGASSLRPRSISKCSRPSVRAQLSRKPAGRRRSRSSSVSHLRLGSGHDQAHLQGTEAIRRRAARCVAVQCGACKGVTSGTYYCLVERHLALPLLHHLVVACELNEQADEREEQHRAEGQPQVL